MSAVAEFCMLNIVYPTVIRVMHAELSVQYKVSYVSTTLELLNYLWLKIVYAFLEKHTLIQCAF